MDQFQEYQDRRRLGRPARVSSAPQPAGCIQRPDPRPDLDLTFVPAYSVNGDRKLLFRVVDYIDPKTGRAVINALSTAPYFRPEMINARSDRVKPGTSTWRPARSVAGDDALRQPASVRETPKSGWAGVNRNQAARASARAADLERRFTALRSESPCTP